MSLQDMAHGLIREYLKLHNYAEAYEAFESEAERRGISKLFNKRMQMLNAIGISAAFKEEFERKKRGEPFLETSLEVLLKCYKERTKGEEQQAADIPKGPVRRRVKSSRHTPHEEGERPARGIVESVAAPLPIKPAKVMEHFPCLPTLTLSTHIQQTGNMALFKRVLFGTKRSATIPDAWYQSFYSLSLSPKTRPKKATFALCHPRSWTIHQREGGPCGVIAIMQARITKYLFYGAAPRVDLSTTFSRVLSVGLPNFLESDLPLPFVTAVLSSLLDTFEVSLKQSPTGCAYVVVPRTYQTLTGDVMWQLCDTTSLNDDSRMQTLRLIHESLGLHRIIEEMDEFVVLTVSSLAEIHDILSSPFYQYYAVTPFPSSFIPAFVVSIVLTRTLQGITRDDFDSSVEESSSPFSPMKQISSDSLFANMNNASIELVNLFIHGKAIAGLHDGVIDCDSLLLKGADAPSDIGILSIYEYYNYLTIGDNMKWKVRYPCFVLFNEAHYTSIFPIDREAAEIVLAAFAKRFFDSRTSIDFVYCDSLDDQSEIVRLTLTLEGPITCKSETSSIIDKSFVNHLLYTLFGDAILSISWNGTEPYL